MAYLSDMPRTLTTILLLILALNTTWFVAYSAQLGLRGLLSDTPTTVNRVFFADTALANVAMAIHMIAGALLTIGAPIQALPFLRRRWPRVHHRLGYTLFGLAILTGIGGLIYIAANGTIGGGWMSLWFAIYGAAIILCAVKTVSHARSRNFDRHFEWATRLVILAVGSWIYRMHYGLWYLATDGLGSNRAFTGPFDLIQVFAFYVPYLLIAEVFLRRRTHTQQNA